MHFQYLVAGFALGSEYDARIASRRGLDLLYVELFKHLLAACGLFGFGHIGTESLYEFQKFLALLLGLLVLLLLLAESELARLIPEAVVAGEERHLVVVYVKGVGRHGVEVKVVGRLVEKQIVGVAEEGFGEQHTHFLVTA